LFPYGHNGGYFISHGPPLHGWFHAFDPQDWLEILTILASGIGRPGRWHGLTAEQHAAVIPETSIGSQHS
jgi:hypothetical protein